MTSNGSIDSAGRAISRRTLLSVGAGLAAASAGVRAVTPGNAADAAPPQLTVAVIGDGRTGVWASLRAGAGGRNLEQELGTKIVWQPGFTASLPVMEAIKAGSIDFTFATATAVANAVPARVPIVPLAAYPLPVDEVDFLVQANSPIKAAADLKGKKIAHQNRTTGTYSLIKYLETAGLRLSDVQSPNIRSPARAQVVVTASTNSLRDADRTRARANQATVQAQGK
ncbi:PhnD/SsuA/transferrin family substrate-binding protein [Bradyrhizobium sp. CCGUVB1N3]|uniref:PhnD/SsuA/transferrin family substrate-binding protein n=1 Tax=Bradyrhizobium sp. CCGUVB1N3 TaxID=2949629 RepID=UPI0020B1D965|nr:PhnD/SsuA/transferrin family substrate-binding protein [Bradyrhizobium sp. CCGUVB1N3]MCP3476497.1 PhnD/SsuA/transferrin family substrate-binding protein [Bradyrhizobium sp. CCGUVB1N3]